MNDFEVIFVFQDRFHHNCLLVFLIGYSYVRGTLPCTSWVVSHLIATLILWYYY